MLRDDRHLPSSSPSMWRELSLHYNGGTTNVMADCRHTKTLGELLSQTLFANHPSPRGAEGSVLKEIESRYRCESSDGIAVSFSLPTHLVPGELYLSVKGGGQHALIGSEVPSTTSAIPATTTRGRGRGRGRGGRGPGRRKRVEEEAEMENGENSEPSENEASSEASDEDDDDESSAAESAEEEQNGGNKRGRGRGAGRGRGRGRPPATVRGKTTTTAAAAAAAAGAKRASSSSPVAATAPQMMMIQQGMIEVPMKRKRGRPPKNPPMMLVPATEAMLAAAAAAAASSSSSSTRATAARRRGAAGALDTARATSGEATVDATSAWLDSVSHEDGHASSFPSSPTTTSAMRERHTRGGDAESLAAVGRRGRAAAADRDGSPASSSVSAGPSKGHLPPMMDVAEVLRPVRPPPPQRRITATVNCFVREVDGDAVDGVAMHRAEVGRLTTKTVAQQHALFDDALEMKRLQPWSTPLHDDEDASRGDPLWAPSLLQEESDESSSASSSTTSSAVQAILSTEEAPNTAAVSAAALWQKQGLTPSFMLADAHSFLAMPQLCLMDPPTTTTSSSTTNVAMKKEEHHQRVSTMAATASWPGHDGCPTSITIPIIVGGCVRLINNESKDRSHRWTVYVRGLHAGFPVASGPNTSATTTTTTTLTNKNDVEDESDYLHRFVDSVTFILDRSFSPCVRTVSSPPFELTEEGWGEFVVSIHVHLRYPVASGSRKAERQRRQLDGFMCGSGGRATLLCSTGPGRAVNALDPITSMNVVSSVCGRGIHTNAQTNADNALVDGLLDINYNSAARSLLYRGPWLPPFLSEDADDDEDEEAMMYGRRRTTPAARRGIQPDGGVVPASPSLSSSSSPSITSHIIGNASYVNAFLNPTAAVAAAATAASSTSAFPAQPSSSSSFSSPATTDANANAPSSPHTNTNNNNNTPGSPNAGKRLIASLSRGHSDDVVVLSHLLRFSHRPKPPVLVPPLMDVRGAHLRGEHVATGYALVSEPVVSEQYDEIYIPIDVCDLQEDDDDDDGATRTKLESEVSGHGMKKEDKDDDEERGIRAGHRRRGRYSRKTAMLLREAGVMERQLRAYLHRHIATGGRELAAVYHHPECCTIKGGVSCWPQIVQHGDAATKDALLTVAFLKSLTATASVEGWLHRALDLHEVAHEQEDGPHTAVGGVLPGPALITKLEFQLATQMMRQHSSRAAMAMFYRDVLPQAVSVGAMVWQAVSAANAVVASAPMHSGSSDGAGGGGGGDADVGTPSSSSSPPTSQQTGGRGVDFALYPLAAELTTPLPVGGANHITAAGRGRGGGGVAPGHHLGAHHHQHHAHHTNTPPYHLLCQQPLPNTFANGEKSTNFGHDGDMDRLVQMKEALMSSIAEMREEVARRQAICAFETM